MSPGWTELELETHSPNSMQPGWNCSAKWKHVTVEILHQPSPVHCTCTSIYICIPWRVLRDSKPRNLVLNGKQKNNHHFLPPPPPQMNFNTPTSNCITSHTQNLVLKCSTQNHANKATIRTHFSNLPHNISTYLMQKPH